MLEEGLRKIIADLIGSAKNIAILTHTNPDGDAIGSSLALGLALKKKGIDARVVIPDGLPDFLRWLPGIELSTTFVYKKEKAIGIIEGADLIFCLDFNDPNRLNGFEEYLFKSKAKKILIDHHEDPVRFADITISETWRGSVGEMIYLFLKEIFEEDILDKDIATCLYVAIMTDTGNFNYASSYPEIFHVVGDLMKYDLEKDRIYSNVYDAFSEDRMRLLGYCLQEKMVVLPGYHTAYISINDEELKRFKHRKGDTEGIVNIPFSVKGVRFTALFIEKKDRIKVSFRSRGSFPVNRIAAEHYQGGGHTNAAGGDSFLSMEETLQFFESLLPAYAELLSEG
ncbi:MAG: bifunctional oligoribonuclease/PAP phosphatase NrnA [Bacteroidales bacterium]|nr:bifunctional oligoribonuclease/PAP phosphatase NrnA [Bacteroidales bacterium]